MSQIVRLTSGPSFVGGLNPAQWAALRYFSGAGPGARSVTAFARHHATSKGTASQTIAALIRKGLLARVRDASDRRVLRFDPTMAGRHLLGHDPMNLVADAIAALPDQDQHSLAALAEKVMNGVLERRRSP
ncbi:MAG: MarR family transcriptional regulator [Alphaproteobacteria bacterium]|nr:MarR family transcriptional regulator [Alphaproteobacteria bacterium]